MAIAAVTAVLVRGIEESANLNTAIVIVKLTVVGIFLVLGIGFILQHPSLAHANWTPFIPPSDGHGNFGFSGITAGAASIFFAYIGFDAVSTAAQEAKNPQRDMPIGILGSLVFCTLLYILVSGVLTGLVNYKALNVADPVAVGIDVTGVRWGSILVKIGAVFGLGTVMLVMLLGQSRVFFSMSRDGLLWKWAGVIHPKFRTPWISNIVVGTIVAFMPALLPIDRLSELVNMGTLLGVRDCVRRGVDPAAAESRGCIGRSRRRWCRWVPILGIVSALYLVWTLPTLTKTVVLGWLVVGLVIYFSYSVKHSKVQRELAEGPCGGDGQAGVIRAVPQGIEAPTNDVGAFFCVAKSVVCSVSDLAGRDQGGDCEAGNSVRIICFQRWRDRSRCVLRCWDGGDLLIWGGPVPAGLCQRCGVSEACFWVHENGPGTSKAVKIDTDIGSSLDSRRMRGRAGCASRRCGLLNFFILGTLQVSLRKARSSMLVRRRRSTAMRPIDTAMRPIEEVHVSEPPVTHEIGGLSAGGFLLAAQSWRRE